jgi:hypothetical protein
VVSEAPKIMDGSAHHRVSALTRSAVVFTSILADIIVNYPLWIYAKRVMAGLSAPAVRHLYKGGGSLLLSNGPMVVLQDGTTGAILKGSGAPPTPSQHALAACASGALGGLCVGAQVESIITRAHATRAPVWRTALSVLAAGGPRALLAPRGALMVAAREVPYAGVLLYLSARVRAAVGDAAGAGAPGAGAATRWAADAAAALLSAAVAGPISHVPSVIASHQQAHNVGVVEACRCIRLSGGFFRGVVPRTCTLAGSLFVIPLTIETVQPMLE